MPVLPRVLLFDIGGVCVASPFQTILEYERANQIPRGYINYSISKTSSTGAWHRLERGEVQLDRDFFHSFKADLENEERWREYHKEGSRSGNAVSTAASNSGSYELPQTLPPTPDVDAERLFWAMMSASGRPDPYMVPALHAIRGSGKFTLAALSNTVIFPDKGNSSGKFAGGDLTFRGVFDVFVSSAHVGMRKPEPRIYQYTMQRLREKVGSDLRPDQVLFFDDIGENLKAARALGMRTIKVSLGRTDSAVRELEETIGMDLLAPYSQVGKAKL